MLEKMAREYMAITRYLLERPEPWVRGEQLLVPREKLIAMLNKNPYRTSTDKLTTWRNLGWIYTDADGEHFTKRIRIDGHFKRVAALNVTAYYELCRLREMGAR